MVDRNAEARHERRLDVAHELLRGFGRKREDVNLGDAAVRRRDDARGLDLPYFGEGGFDVLDLDTGDALVHLGAPCYGYYCYDSTQPSAPANAGHRLL